MIYITTTTKSLDGLGALWSKTKQQFNKHGKMERNKLPFAKTKTLSLRLRWCRATIRPATADSQREEGRYFSRTSNLRIQSNNRKKYLRQEYQACWVLQAPWADQSVLQSRMWKREWLIHSIPNKKSQTKLFTRPWSSPREDVCP